MAIMDDNGRVGLERRELGFIDESQLVVQEVIRNPDTTLCAVTVRNKLHASTIQAALFYLLL